MPELVRTKNSDTIYQLTAQEIKDLFSSSPITAEAQRMYEIITGGMNEEDYSKAQTWVRKNMELALAQNRG